MNQVINTKQELIQALILHAGEIQSFGVKCIGIFGSFVHGNVTQNSDVDFYIDFDPEYKTLKNFVGLSTFLQRISGRKVEIVTPQSLNQFTGNHITRDVEYVTLAA